VLTVVVTGHSTSPIIIIIIIIINQSADCGGYWSFNVTVNNTNQQNRSLQTISKLHHFTDI